jgi:hypothetical protein
LNKEIDMPRYMTPAHGRRTNDRQFQIEDARRRRRGRQLLTFLVILAVAAVLLYGGSR